MAYGPRHTLPITDPVSKVETDKRIPLINPRLKENKRKREGKRGSEKTQIIITHIRGRIFRN